MNSSNPQFLNDDGTPNLSMLSTTFQRCGPSVAGGLAWLDNTRFCRWDRQWVDGKKHDVPNDPKGAAFPFDGASDVKPMIVDDIVLERAAMKFSAFWMAQAHPAGVGTDNEAGGYAVALKEHLMFDPSRFQALIREVELSANYEEHYGWMLLAPRWKRELGVRRQKVTMENIQAAAQQAAQARMQQQAQAAQGGQQAAPSDGSTPGLELLPMMIMDPAQEDQAVAFLQEWYDGYVKAQLPEDMQERAPQVTAAQARKVVKSLRTTGQGIAPLPYLAKDEPEIVALKPYDEAFIPPELTTANEIVFQIERTHEVDLRNRVITEGYDEAWVDKVVKLKGALTAAPMEIRSTPVGIGGLIGGASSSPVFSAQPTLNNSMIEIVHAVYHGIDEDGIPAVLCTTLHLQVNDSYGLHEIVEGSEGELPYTYGAREWWCRSVTASRGVPEKAHTQQNVIKGLIDSMIDRSSITTMPPLNVYESPTGHKYAFGPGVKNYVKMGREPKFMEGLNPGGMEEASEVLKTIKGILDNSHGLMSGDVSPARLQMSQQIATMKFLSTWNMAFQIMLNLCRVHMEDDQFADITGAPSGWLDAHRDDTDCLSCQFSFDVRELDPELSMKRIEAMNNIALPNDTLGVINRAAWASYMVRAILGSRASKMMVVSQPDASQALSDKAELQVLKMFAGNQPALIDKMDPTAPGLLQATQKNIMANQTYLRSLNDDALAAVAGPNAQQIAQQLGNQRTPNDQFSGTLMDWLKNLQFIGVTQVQNRQDGRTGVNQQQQQQPQ